MDNVNVRSGIKGRVSVNLPDLRFKREWPKMGAVIPVDFKILQEAIFDDGFSRMLKNGILVIDDMKAKIALGLESEGSTEPNLISLNEMQMVKLLKIDPIEEFTKVVNKLSRAQLETLADLAIEKEIYDFAKTDLIKEKVGIDVRKTIELNRADKEPEKVSPNQMPQQNNNNVPPFLQNK